MNRGHFPRHLLAVKELLPASRRESKDRAPKGECQGHVGTRPMTARVAGQVDTVGDHRRPGQAGEGPECSTKEWKGRQGRVTASARAPLFPLPLVASVIHSQKLNLQGPGPSLSPHRDATIPSSPISLSEALSAHGCQELLPLLFMKFNSCHAPI